MVKIVPAKPKDLRMFAVLPVRAIKDPRLTAKNLRVLAAFCSYADHMGRTFVSLQRVGEDVGLGRRGVHYHVTKLRKVGYMVYCKPFFRNQRSTSNRIVFDPLVKNEETIRSRLTVKQQMDLAELEATIKEQLKHDRSGLNTQVELDLSVLRERFVNLCNQFFTDAMQVGLHVTADDREKGARMLATQAVDLIRTPTQNADEGSSYVGI